MADDEPSIGQAQLCTRGFAIVFTLACFALTGCDNAGERISLSPWKEVGTRVPPVSDLKGGVDVVTTQVAPGEGRAVEAGDLVKIQFTTSRMCWGAASGVADFVGQSEPQTAWLWTGREPEPHKNRWEEENRWGGLGSARFRAALIGKRVGEKLRVRLADGAGNFQSESIPLKGFSVFQHFATTLFQRRDELPRWPESQVASKEFWADVEILSACGGALHRREATMEQWGSVSTMFGGRHYKSRRADTIRWSALEGRCGPPDGKVWLQIGPLYYVNIGDWQQTNLHDWASSYKRLHPSKEFPEKYDFKSKPPRRHCDRPQASEPLKN